MHLALILSEFYPPCNIVWNKRLAGNSFFSVIMMQNILLTVKAYLDGKIHNGTLSVMDSPPQSPDFNIIEAV